MKSPELSTFLTVASLGLWKCTLLFVLSRSKRKRHVGKLSRITLFPVKSMRGTDVKEAMCTNEGISAGEIRDRCFMVVDAGFRFVSARKLPQLSVIKSTVQNEHLILDAPSMSSIHIKIPSVDTSPVIDVTVWMEPLEGLDCGDEAAQWLEQFLGKGGLRLVCHQAGLKKRKCTDGPTSWHKASKPTDEVTYQDGYPYMLMTEASIVELNSRLQSAVKIDNFRPNLVVEGCKAFDEDDWDKIYIGNVEFTNMKPCARCIMTTVDPETGVRDPNLDPLRTLRSYRLMEEELGNSPCFGINLAVDKPGIITVGSDVMATRK